MNLDFERHHFFWSRVDRSNPEGCWPWTGATHRGVGALEFCGRKTDPRRVAYVLAFGEIPKATPWVTSACKNRLCCRPDHFQLKGVKFDSPEFWNHVEKTPGCWYWHGPATIEFQGRSQPPWRISYALAAKRHRVPRRAFVRQSCGTINCVRPDHLELAWLHGRPLKFNSSTAV